MNASSREWTNSQQGYERLPTSEDDAERWEEEIDGSEQETNLQTESRVGHEDRTKEHNNQQRGDEKDGSKEYKCENKDYESQTEDTKEKENGDQENQTEDEQDRTADCRNKPEDHKSQTEGDKDQTEDCRNKPEDHKGQTENNQSKIGGYRYQTVDDKNQTRQNESDEIPAKTKVANNGAEENINHSNKTDNQEESAYRKYSLVSSSEESSRGYPDSSNEDSIEDTTDNLLPSETVIFFVMSYLTGMSMINTPVILRYTGWGGVCAIIVVVLVLAYTCNILLKGFVGIKAKKPDIFISYITPYEERTSCWVMILTFGFILYLLLSAITVLVETATIVASLSNKHGHIPKFLSASPAELRVTVTLIGMGLLPLTLFRSPKSYWWFSIVCIISSVLAGLLLTTLLGNVERRNPPYYDKYTTTNENYVIHISAGICNLIRFFGLHAVLSILVSDMKEPDSAPRVVSTGFLIPTIFIVIVAMMSYFAFGTDIGPNLLEMFDKIPNNGKNSFISVSVIAVKGLLCMQMSFVYLLIMNALNLYFEHEALATNNNCHCCLVRAFTTMMVILLGATVPHFAYVLVFVNIILSCFIGVIFPLIFSINSINSHAHHYIIHGIIIFVVTVFVIATFYGVLIKTNFNIFGVTTL